MTRLGGFFKFLATNCLLNEGKNFGLFQIMSLLHKRRVATFWAILMGS